MAYPKRYGDILWCVTTSEHLPDIYVWADKVVMSACGTLSMLGHENKRGKAPMPVLVLAPGCWVSVVPVDYKTRIPYGIGISNV